MRSFRARPALSGTAQSEACQDMKIHITARCFPGDLVRLEGAVPCLVRLLLRAASVRTHVEHTGVGQPYA